MRELIKTFRKAGCTLRAGLCEDRQGGERTRRGDGMTKTRKPNPNTNCLEGMACPKCGSFGPFNIDAIVSVTVTDNGTEDDGCDYSWEKTSACRCVACDHAGTIGTFTAL